jgi:hypothetical protein
MSVAPSPEPPFSPSTAWQEVALPDEQNLIDRFAQDIGRFQKEDEDAKRGKPFRGFHAKPHAGLIAEFQVLGDLPDYARQGVFAMPRIFPALVRFSNGDSVINKDKHAEPRGIAIKLIGVEGSQLLPERKDAVTQDFLATSHSVTAGVRHIGQFADFVRAHRTGPLAQFVNLWKAFGPKETARIVAFLVRHVILSKVRSMATEEFSGTAPIKFGPHAVKFTVRPFKDTAPPAHRALTENFLKEELAERLRKSDLKFDFLVQFYVDDVKTPIEDTSVPWRLEDAPFVKVAQLRIPRCELTDKFTDHVDDLSFSPWHAVVDHRPLGSVMRARKVAYAASSKLRQRSPEPTKLPQPGG